jgi:hypothetical protein
MQGPVPTVQRNGNRRFVTTVSGRLLLIRIFEQPNKYHNKLPSTQQATFRLSTNS